MDTIKTLLTTLYMQRKVTKIMPNPNFPALPTPHELGQMAVDNAAELAAQDALNLHCVEMHMRAFAGAFNGSGRLDDHAYSQLPEAAQVATLETADTSYDYFRRVGLDERVDGNMSFLFARGVSIRYRNSFLINAMQRHVAVAALLEPIREVEAVQRGVLPASFDKVYLDMPLEDPASAELQRLDMQQPYSVEGIRSVLQVFGKNLGPFIEGVVEVAPNNLTVGRLSIIGYAAGCITAARLSLDSSE